MGYRICARKFRAMYRGNQGVDHGLSDRLGSPQTTEKLR